MHVNASFYRHRQIFNSFSAVLNKIATLLYGALKATMQELLISTVEGNNLFGLGG